MTGIVFLLEEESARVLLEAVVERIRPPASTTAVRYVVFEGKQDLSRRLGRRLAGYVNTNAHFIVLRDQDASDCRTVKSDLKRVCQTAGRPQAIVRIACRELEAFYLGDLAAVENGLGVRGLATKADKAKFRNPDAIPSPSIELARLTKSAYQKVAGSRAIAPHLDLDAPRSRSFRHLIAAIRAALEGPGAKRPRTARARGN